MLSFFNRGKIRRAIWDGLVGEAESLALVE